MNYTQPIFINRKWATVHSEIIQFGKYNSIEKHRKYSRTQQVKRPEKYIIHCRQPTISVTTILTSHIEFWFTQRNTSLFKPTNIPPLHIFVPKEETRYTEDVFFFFVEQKLKKHIIGKNICHDICHKCPLQKECLKVQTDLNEWLIDKLNDYREMQEKIEFLQGL